MIFVSTINCVVVLVLYGTVEPLLRGHPYERPPSLERPLDYVNLNMNVFNSTPPS